MDDRLRKVISARLVYFRKLRGQTQYDLAAAAGISTHALRGYEQRKTWPSDVALERIASALGISPIELFCAHADTPKVTPEDALEALRTLVETTKQK